MYEKKTMLIQPCFIHFSRDQFRIQTTAPFDTNKPASIMN